MDFFLIKKFYSKKKFSHCLTEDPHIVSASSAEDDDGGGFVLAPPGLVTWKVAPKAKIDSD